jgi:hypothetical protein
MTMSEAAPTPTTEAPAVSPAGLSIEERAADIFGSDPGPAPAAPEPAAAAPAPPAVVEPDEAAKARAARRQALQQAQERERERVDASTAIRERDELRQRLAAAEEKSKAYATHIDPAKLTKEQFFALAERNPELTPQELGEWLRERMANPEAAAAKAARLAVDPEIAALRKQNEDLAAQLQDFLSRQQTTAQQAEEQRAASEFFAFTQQNAASSPLAATFLEKHGAEEFLKLAQSAVQFVPEHAGPQGVLDEIEERLTTLVSPYMTATPQRSQATNPSHPAAAAKAPTNVSNTLAQQRSSVVDESADFAGLSVEERANRLFGT